MERVADPLHLDSMTRSRSFFTWLIAPLIAVPIFAHDPGLSSVHVTRTAVSVGVELRLAWSDLAPLMSREAGSERPSATALTALSPEFAKSGERMVRISVNDRLQPDGDLSLALGPIGTGEVAVSLVWRHVSIDPIRVEFPILAKMPFGHRMILTVGDSADAAALLDAHHPSWELPVVTSRAVGAASISSEVAHPIDLLAFVRLGVEHILMGFDHLCFLFALLLVAPRGRQMLAVVTTFTVAHSLTLAAAATGLVSLSPRLVEPLIAASIIYVAVENLFLRRAPRHRLALVFGFGLVHGLGFASALAERLPGVTGVAMIPPLLGFNVGVEAGQLAVAACLIPLMRLARTRPAIAPKLQPAFSLAIAAAGIVWFCQRV